MTRLHRIVARAGLAAIAIGALSLAAAPVAAHTGSLFTVQGGDEGPQSFATISQTDAAVTPLANSLPAGADLNGIEIFNETGYALFNVVGEGYFIVTWDHNTGAIGTPVPLVGAPNVTPLAVYGLDTTNNGTIIAFADVQVLENEFPVPYEWVVSIDPVTGEMLELVDITGASPFLDGLATDPTTGNSYAFVDTDDGTPQYLLLDLAAGTYAGPVDLLQIHATLGDGYIYGADFDTAGTLWFFYSGFQLEDRGLSFTTSAFSETVEAVLVGTTGGDIQTINLAYDPLATPTPTPGPQLAATGLVPDAVLGAGLALVLAGAVALTFTRRRASA